MKIVANFTNVTFNYCKQSLYCSYQGQCCSFESFVNYFAIKNNNNKIPVIPIYQSEKMKTSRDIFIFFKGWIQNKDHVYRLFTDKKTWNDAKVFFLRCLVCFLIRCILIIKYFCISEIDVQKYPF